VERQIIKGEVPASSAFDMYIIAYGFYGLAKAYSSKAFEFFRPTTVQFAYLKAEV
jgi:hypothetical protein